MDKILDILSQGYTKITLEDIDIPVKDTCINSIDLISIRVALENHFLHEVEDRKWYQFESLREAIVYFKNCSPNIKQSEIEVEPIQIKRDYEIGMPQMANYALSENWLLRELGDLHWNMLSTGLDKKSVDLKDEFGNRLYATFIRIQYKTSPLYKFNESEQLILNGNIERYGSNAYFSKIIGNCGMLSIVANLMTSFSIRESNDNSKIHRCNSNQQQNLIKKIDLMPKFLTDYRLLRNSDLEELVHDDSAFMIESNVLGEIEYSLNPYYDINGVGLLYYASYPIISDICCTKWFNLGKDIQEYDTEYFTTHRDIFYFANCNHRDKIICRLNTCEIKEDSQIKLSTSLFRVSDNTLMAKIFTVKERFVS